MGFSRQEPTVVGSHFLLRGIVPMTVLEFFLPDSLLKWNVCVECVCVEWVGGSSLPALTLQIL